MNNWPGGQRPLNADADAAGRNKVNRTALSSASLYYFSKQKDKTIADEAVLKRPPKYCAKNDSVDLNATFVVHPPAKMKRRMTDYAVPSTVRFMVNDNLADSGMDFSLMCNAKGSPFSNNREQENSFVCCDSSTTNLFGKCNKSSKGFSTGESAYGSNNDFPLDLSTRSFGKNLLNDRSFQNMSVIMKGNDTIGGNTTNVFDYKNYDFKMPSSTIQMDRRKLAIDETAMDTKEFSINQSNATLFKKTKPAKAKKQAVHSKQDKTRAHYLNRLDTWSAVEISAFYKCESTMQPETEKPEGDQPIKSIAEEVDEIDGSLIMKVCDSDPNRHQINLETDGKMLSQTTVDTYYECDKVLKTSTKLILEYFNVQQSQDWNKEVDTWMETMNADPVFDPNMDYNEYKLSQKGELADSKICVGSVDEVIDLTNLDNEGDLLGDIPESLEEIHESFTNPKGIKTSTPNNKISLSSQRLNSPDLFEPNELDSELFPLIHLEAETDVGNAEDILNQVASEDVLLANYEIAADNIVG